MRASDANRLMGNISLLYLGDDILELAASPGPGVDLSDTDLGFEGKTYGPYRKMWGCDEAVCQGMILQLGEKTVFTAPTMVRYGERWYLMSFASQYTRLWNAVNPFCPVKDPVKWSAQAPSDRQAFEYTEPQTAESAGFDTPQDAADAYITAWKQGNTAEMLRCFAIESMVDHFDAEAWLNSRAVTSITEDPAKAVPVTNDMSRATLIAARQSALIKSMVNGYKDEIGLPEMKSGVFVDASVLASLQSVWKDSDIADPDTLIFGNIITGDGDGLRALLGDEAADAVSNHEARLYRDYIKRVNTDILGCEALRELWIPLDMNGTSCLFALTCAQYGDRWYIFSPGGYLNEALRDFGQNNYWRVVYLQK